MYLLTLYKQVTTNVIQCNGGDDDDDGGDDDDDFTVTFFHVDLREMLNAKQFGCSSMSLLRRVLLPTPEGPQKTTGRMEAIARGGVSDRIVSNLLLRLN